MKAHQSLLRAAPKGVNSLELSTCSVGDQQAPGRRNHPGKETQVLAVRSPALCTKAAEPGVSVGQQQHLRG